MGVHDSYCFICGIPVRLWMYGYKLEDFSPYYEFIDVLNEGEFYPSTRSKKTKKIKPMLLQNYKEYINNLKHIIKLVEKWSSDVLYITDYGIITDATSPDADYGSVDLGKYGTQSVMKFLWDPQDNTSRTLVCHKSCHKLINYDIRIDDIVSKLNDHSLLKNYGAPIINKNTNAQDFEWENIVLNNSKDLMDYVEEEKKIVISNTVNYLMDPLYNKENAKRILKVWDPIIKKLKTKPAKKLRPSPTESATTFKVGDKKKGNDGNMYVIIKDKNGVKRWKKI